MSRIHLGSSCNLRRRLSLQAVFATAFALPDAVVPYPTTHQWSSDPRKTPMQNNHPMPAGIHDFDFLLGHWHVKNRRLVKRLQNNHDWEVFGATQQNVALPGGIGNFDDFIAETWRPGYVGMSLRLFNPQTQLWSIYWLDNQTAGVAPSGILLPPVVGKFDAGLGVFEGDDELEGRPIRVRYTWSNMTPISARWEQAMSADSGKTWEMNWRMDFERSAKA